MGGDRTVICRVLLPGVCRCELFFIGFKVAYIAKRGYRINKYPVLTPKYPDNTRYIYAILSISQTEWQANNSFADYKQNKHFTTKICIPLRCWSLITFQADVACNENAQKPWYNRLIQPCYSCSYVVPCRSLLFNHRRTIPIVCSPNGIDGVDLYWKWGPYSPIEMKFLATPTLLLFAGKAIWWCWSVWSVVCIYSRAQKLTRVSKRSLKCCWGLLIFPLILRKHTDKQI